MTSRRRLVAAAGILLGALLLAPAARGQTDEVPIMAAPAAAVDIEIRGLEGDPLKNVQTVLTLPAGVVRDGTINLPWLQRFVRQTPAKAREALEPFGFYAAEVATELLPDGEQKYRLIVTVRPGEPVRVASLRLAVEGPGGSERQLQQLLREFPLAQGAPLRQDWYETAKWALKSRATDLGYLDADFTAQTIRVEPARRTADIELVLATGPRYHFGPTSISGAPDYPEEFLRRYLGYRQDEFFAHAALGQAQLNLLSSTRFREVVITPQLEAARLAGSTSVPIDIRLVPAPSRRLRPGIGFGTDTGARVSLNYSDLNVLDRGHEFTTSLVVAQLRQSLEANYILPDERNINTQTALRLGGKRDNLGTYDSRSLFTEIERLQGLSRDRLFSYYLRLLQEDFEIGSEDSRSRLVIPGMRFSQRRYQGQRRPTRGYQYALETRGSAQSLGSDTSLLQLLGSANLLQPLTGRWSLLLRAEAGITTQDEPFAEVPPSLRFFAGGDTSIRGYGYQSLGPRDASGNVIGGKNLLVGSIELERSLSDDWGVAVFYDAGNAFDSFSNLEYAQGAGIGARWYTLVGPIKLDLARRIGEPKPGYRLHLSVGLAF